MTSNAQLFKRAGNQAVDVNPAAVDIGMTTHGSNWLWAVFCVFALFSLVYAFLFLTAERKSARLSKFAIASPLWISLIMTFAYFTMASNLGWTGIQAEFNHASVSNSSATPGIRQIFYAKYIAWFLCWPLLLYSFELATATTDVAEEQSRSFFESLHNLLVQIAGVEFFVIGLLVGALIRSSYKWGYWTMAAFAAILVAIVLFKHQLVTLRVRGWKIIVLSFTQLCVFLYFVCWGLSEGGNVIQPDSEVVFYGILDLCVFALVPAFLSAFVSSKGSLGFIPSLPMHGKNRNHGTDLEKQSNHEPVRHSGETEVPETGVFGGTTAPGTTIPTSTTTHAANTTTTANTTTAGPVGNTTVTAWEEEEEKKKNSFTNALFLFETND